MYVVVTLFSIDNGHLDSFPISDLPKLRDKLVRECVENGDDWIEEQDICLQDFFDTDEAGKILELCEMISRRGHFNVVEIPQETPVAKPCTIDRVLRTELANLDPANGETMWYKATLGLRLHAIRKSGENAAKVILDALEDYFKK